MQDWARRAGRVCLIAVLVAILAVSVWTPIGDADIAARWFSWPNIGLLAPVPVITALIAAGEWYALPRQNELMPFLGAVGLFPMSFIGIAISLWPMIVPFHYTLWQAASSGSTQAFLLIGTLVPAADNPHVHRVVLLGVPRQGARRHWLSPLSFIGINHYLHRHNCRRAGDWLMGSARIRRGACRNRASGRDACAWPLRPGPDLCARWTR